MTKQQLKDILDRALAWSPKDQERLVRFERQVEEGLSPDDISDEEWKLIEERIASHDVASDAQAKKLFAKVHEAPNHLTPNRTGCTVWHEPYRAQRR